MKTRHILHFAAFLAILVIGCGKREKRTHRFEGVEGGAPPAREECTVQTLDCFDKCYKREAAATCIGCCRDQDYLCDMQQKHSFEYCETTR